LPSARSGALGKEIKKKIFAECLTAGARQRRTWHGAVSRAAYAECIDFAESLALGKEVLCRVPVFAECPALGKEIFAECNSLPSAALGKEDLCRVSDFWHSAKKFTLGKVSVSSSEQLLTRLFLYFFRCYTSICLSSNVCFDIDNCMLYLFFSSTFFLHF